MIQRRAQDITYKATTIRPARPRRQEIRYPETANLRAAFWYTALRNARLKGTNPYQEMRAMMSGKRLAS